MMHRFLYIILVAVVYMIFNSLGLASAQTIEATTPDSVGIDSEKARNVILDPSVDPGLYSEEVDYRLENSIFFGPSHIGVEATLLQSYTSMYGSLFAGLAGNSGPGGSIRGSAWVTGISIGQQMYLRGRSEFPLDNRVVFYLRGGPGVGLGGTGTFLGSDSVYHFGLNAHGITGAEFLMSERTSFFIHGGARVLWFPGMDEVGFFTTPLISIGIKFTSSSGIAPVRY